MRLLVKLITVTHQSNDVISLFTAFILGQALLTSVWIFLGLSSLLLPIVVSSILFLLLGVGVWLGKSSLGNLIPAVRDQFKWLQQESLVFKLILLLLILLILLFGVGAYLNPPIGDAEAFYLTYSKIIADSHRLLPMHGLYSTFSQIGLAGEMHFAVLMMLGGANAAKFFMWPVAITIAVMLLGICSKLGVGPRGKWIALIILFTSTSFTHYIIDGKVDLFAAALGMAAFYWILNISTTALIKFTIPLVGLLSGFAVVAKFSYLAAFVPVAIILIAWRCYLLFKDEGKNNRDILKSLIFIFVKLGLWALLATLPHLIKNGVLFGAPFAPFFGVSEAGKWHEQVWFAPEVTRWIVMTYPFALAFGRYPMQGGNISFLILAFLPLVWFLTRPKNFLRNPYFQVTFAALIGLILWVIVRPSVIAPRYILATLFLFIPLIAYATEYVYDHELKPRILEFGINVCIVFALAISLYPYANLPVKVFKHVNDSLHECDMASPYCLPLTGISESAGTGDRIYYVGYYTYWLRTDLLQCINNGDDDALLEAEESSSNSILALSKLGFSYLVVEKSHSNAERFMASANQEQAPGFELETVLDNPDMAVFRIKSLNDPEPKLTECRQDSQAGWHIVRKQ